MSRIIAGAILFFTSFPTALAGTGAPAAATSAKPTSVVITPGKGDASVTVTVAGEQPKTLKPSASKKCTRRITLDLTEKPQVFDPIAVKSDDVVCFQYIAAPSAATVTYDSEVTVSGPIPAFITWADVNEVIGMFTGDSTKIPGSKQTANDFDKVIKCPDKVSKPVKASTGSYLCPRQIGSSDTQSYSLASGYSAKATVTGDDDDSTDESKSWQQVVFAPSWRMFLGIIVPSAWNDRTYVLGTPENGQSKIDDVSSHRLFSTNRLYPSLFWLHDSGHWWRNLVLGLGVNGGKPAVFVGNGTMLWDQSVSIVVGAAFVPMTVLNAQYQYDYQNNLTVSSTTNPSSMTTTDYKATLFVGLGFSFCISSCSNQANSNPDTAGKNAGSPNGGDNGSQQ